MALVATRSREASMTGPADVRQTAILGPVRALALHVQRVHSSAASGWRHPDASGFLVLDRTGPVACSERRGAPVRWRAQLELLIDVPFA
jgi:hypothetical protein